MKKTLFLLAILASTASFGQIRIGASASLLIPANHYDSKYISPHTAGEFLIDFSMPIKNRLLFTSGVGYASFKFSQDGIRTDNAGNKIGTTSYFYLSDYITVPIGIRYEFSDKKISPFASFSVKSLIKVKDNAYINNASDYQDVVILKATSFIIQPSVDLGLRFLIKQYGYLNISASYNYQIQSTYKQYQDQEFKYNSIGINIGGGYRF